MGVEGIFFCYLWIFFFILNTSPVKFKSISLAPWDHMVITDLFTRRESHTYLSLKIFEPPPPSTPLICHFLLFSLFTLHMCIYLACTFFHSTIFMFGISLSWFYKMFYFGSANCISMYCQTPKRVICCFSSLNWPPWW